MTFEHACANMRTNMIEQQVRPWNVLDPKVLTLMYQIPRETYVPEAYRHLAYADTQIPLGFDQVMLTPREAGRILQALQVKHQDNVLEIGTGSGYLTTLLSLQAKQVLSLEIFPEIAEAARQRCEKYPNITIEVKDVIAEGIPQSSFDIICVTGALPELPVEWQKQLTLGGRLFVVLGQAPIMQATLITRVGEQEWKKEVLYDTLVPWLVHAEPAPAFQF